MASDQPSGGPSFGDRLSQPTEGTSTSWADDGQEESVNNTQMDGAAEPFNGSSLHEPDYAVDVKLSDLQADPNNPLFSVKSFEDLGLYVLRSQNS